MLPIDKTEKRFLRTESYGSRSGFVWERDVYGVFLKETEVNSDGVLVTPDMPLAEIYENDRPKGLLFKGKNRKERRQKGKI